MRLSGSLAAPAALLVAIGSAPGCDAASLTPDGGGGPGGATGGSPGFTEKLSDFEDLVRATVVQAGEPARNGYWYTYNDGFADCVQQPPPGDLYIGEAPPSPSPGPSAGLALHARWTRCGFEGAGTGIGADFNVPFTGAVVYSGPKVPYDITSYAGLTFWAMATPGTDTRLRVTFPMRATTPVQAGGLCDERVVGQFQCGDDWGVDVDLPTNGTWKQITVRFSDAAFAREGWGTVVPWNPADVTGVQIRAIDAYVVYDFYVDDAWLLR